MMIKDTSAAPQALDTRTRARDAAPRLARHYNPFHPPGGKINFLLKGDFRQPYGVSRCATQHGDAVVDHGPQTRGTAQTTSRDAEAAQARRGFKGCPKPEEGCER